MVNLLCWWGERPLESGEHWMEFCELSISTRLWWALESGELCMWIHLEYGGPCMRNHCWSGGLCIYKHMWHMGDLRWFRPPQLPHCASAILWPISFLLDPEHHLWSMLDIRNTLLRMVLYRSNRLCCLYPCWDRCLNGP